MRILHVIPYFYPAWAYGGPPRAAFEIARRQVKLGHDVTVLTTNAFEKHNKLPSGCINIEGIKVLRVKNISNFLMWNLHFPTPFGIRKVLKRQVFDIIHLHETRTLLNWQILKLLTGKEKIIFSPWGTFSLNNSLVIFKKLFDMLFLAGIKNKIDISLGQNSHETTLLEKWEYGNKVKLLPLGIDFEYFIKLPSRKDSRKKIGLQENDFIFLFLGRFSKEKGLGLLIKSFAEFIKGKDNLKLLLVGRDDGYLYEMRKIIKELKLEEKIIIRGPLYNRDRLNVYAASNAFVFTPIVFEETSTACLEALACNLPVITTKEAEIPYLDISDFVYQIKASENEVIRVMDKIYTSKNNLNINKKKIKEYFDWNNIVKKIMEI